MHESEIKTLIIAGKAIVELTSVERVHAANQKQVLTYVRLTGWKPGYLLNWGRSPDIGWHYAHPPRRGVSLSLCLRENQERGVFFLGLHQNS